MTMRKMIICPNATLKLSCPCFSQLQNIGEFIYFYFPSLRAWSILCLSSKSRSSLTFIPFLACSEKLTWQAIIKRVIIDQERMNESHSLVSLFQLRWESADSKLKDVWLKVCESAFHNIKLTNIPEKSPSVKTWLKLRWQICRYLFLYNFSRCKLLNFGTYKREQHK